jgi:hypothetical protein
MKINRKEFLSILVLSALSPKILADYSEKVEESSLQDMNYILLNFYESPPRWLFDLPLKAKKTSKFLPSAMISTRYQDHIPVYKTINYKGIEMPSLLTNEIPTTDGSKVKIERIFDNALVIRGCNMNRDGHDSNSKILESAAEGKISLGGAIAKNSNKILSAVSVNGERADIFKTVISSFLTEEGNKASNAEDGKDNLIRNLISLFENKSEVSEEKLFDSIFSKLNKHIKSKSDYHYKEINKLSKLPFNRIYTEYEDSFKKYKSLIDKCFKEFEIDNVTNVPIKGASFPVTFKLNKEKSTSVLDYLGEYQLCEHILIEDDIQSVFKTENYDELAHRFALIEVTLIHNISNVLLINLDPIKLKEGLSVIPNKKIKSHVSGNHITFKVDPSYTVTKKKYVENYSNDGHFIGTHATLIGCSRMYQLFSTCLFEFQSFLKQEDLFNKTLIHITSEFERAPHLNQSGSDHGWKGHTSTLINGRIEDFKVVGAIEPSSSNTLKNLSCTWGESAYNAGLGRKMRYGDIVKTISEICKVNSPQGGKSLVKISKSGFIQPRFKEKL